MRTREKLNLKKIIASVAITAGMFSLLYFLFGLAMGWSVFSGIIVILFLGILLIIYGRACLRGESLFARIRPKALKAIVSAGLVIFLLSFVIIEGTIIYNGFKVDNENPDYIIVLGAAMKGSRPSLELADRLDRSLEFYRKHTAERIIVTGGKGIGEDIAEGQFMKGYLVEHGIPSERVICEDKSESTWENIVNSRKIIQETDKRQNIKLTIVTNDFHMFRAKFLARREGFIAYGYPTGTPFYIIPNHFVREYFAIIKSAVLDRAIPA